jgi:hypothetical protein
LFGGCSQQTQFPTFPAKLVSLVGLIDHIIGLNSLNGFSLIGLSGPSDIMGLISLGLVELNSHISLVGLGCFSCWLARARKKIWYSDNNDALQDFFAAAILAAAARTNGVAMTSSATKITNAAIWYYCAASHWFVRESWLCYVISPTGRLDSSFFGDALQNENQYFLSGFCKC